MVAPSARPALVKPRMRGVLHQWAFFVSLILGLVLVLAANGGRETFAASVYAGSVAALLGTSALYHRVNWSRTAARLWMRRLDHAMIFVLIAGTYTPFGLLVLEGTLATAILIAVWSGAVAGIVLQLVWVQAPKWVSALVYVALGWVAVLTFPGLIDGIGVFGTLLVAAGGLLYTVGAVVYALGRPDPAPTVFGYHEIFHALVIVAAALQYAAIAFYVV
ncbi:MAG: FIG01964566: Predicted membrane protein, hemolysin III homolog [uncultured Solirubrobacteraceae bacterium]|uniref:FIG01964566: Predicted membrane protein, hemolysin III homolog n=1 Tax=uncultured Solirubrobacteraceae bacterium TaxID=1162706 RepID=A0A6J4RJ28_9ACTN|nr:MAG: FIG01964566: Predicted membrane protein, hemolysin III homolog [uncultured Solirubrobacteraceae bacterium]